MILAFVTASLPLPHVQTLMKEFTSRQWPRKASVITMFKFSNYFMCLHEYSMTQYPGEVLSEAHSVEFLIGKCARELIGVMAACSRMSPPGTPIQAPSKKAKEKSGTDRSFRKKGSPYRHVPHSQKPVHLVQKRNARERRRVQAVNGAFSRLRKHVPLEHKHKRLSKVKTLRVAIDYIRHLEDLITEHDRRAPDVMGDSFDGNLNDVTTDTCSWIHNHTEMYTAPRRCMRLVHYPPSCQAPINIHRHNFRDCCAGQHI